MPKPGSIRAALYVCLLAALLLQRAVVAAPTEIVIFAADVPSTAIVGDWVRTADTSAARGVKLRNPNRGTAKPAETAAPVSYFDVTFTADAGTPYHLWLRMRADSNSYNNDSVYVWVNNATTPLHVILEEGRGAGVSGWGWNDQNWGGLAPHLTFATAGSQRLRIGVREDGVSIDQIVLSPAAYLTTRPGLTKNDTTILDGGTTPPPPALTLVREPYLHQVSDHSAIVVWASREPGPARVVVGGRSVTATSYFYDRGATGLTYDYYQHQALVTGLSASTLYGYTVYVGNTAASDGTDLFRTAPTPGTGSVSFVVIGDSGTGSAEQFAIADRIGRDSFDIFLHAGDIAYPDSTHSTLQQYFFNVYRDILRRRPLFPSMGNHDSRPANDWGFAYRNVFVLPDEAGLGEFGDHAERYYSFDYGPVHFVVLDTEYAFQAGARRDAQVAWLAADLAASTQPWKVALYHKPPYNSGRAHGSNLEVRAAFEPLFEKYGVQIAVASHEHSYERSAPWRQVIAPDRPQAVTHVVTGGGGAPLYELGGLNKWTSTWKKAHHYLKVTISGCTAAIVAKDKNGAAIDSYTLDKCEQETDGSSPTVTLTNPPSGSQVSGPIAVGADASDDTRVEKVDFFVDNVLRAVDTVAPYEFTWDTSAEAAGTHSLRAEAHDLDGFRALSGNRTVTVTATTPPADTNDIVLHAADVPASAIVGDWAVTADSTAADGLKLRNPNRGAAKVSASAAPVSYFDVTFDAEAGVPYHLWFRMRADSNSYSNDSVYVWVNGATTPLHVILEEGRGAGVSGWGWNDQQWGGLAPHLTFATGGRQRLRIGVREDGVSIDQIVLSPSRFLTTRPGALKNDTTILAR